MKDRTAIEKLVADQEEAIASRGFEQVFTTYRNAYVNSTGGAQVEQSADMLLVKRFLMSSSFIAAQYRLTNDKTNRDKAAQSCALLLSNFGHDPMEMLEEHIRCEDLWLRIFKEQGIARSTPFGCIVVSIVLLCLVAVVYSLVG